MEYSVLILEFREVQRVSLILEFATHFFEGFRSNLMAYGLRIIPRSTRYVTDANDCG